MPHSPVIQTLADLVRINSVNSSYEGGPGEREIATFVRSFFERRGIGVTEQEVFPNRPNILARLPGRDSNRCLVLEAHTDTVSVKGMTIPPFEPRIENGKMFGRGSCDTKAGLAAMMHAVASLKEEGITPPCDVLLAAVVDEEFSYRGVVRLCEMWHSPRGCVPDSLPACPNTTTTGWKPAEPTGRIPVPQAAIVAEPTELRCVIATKGVLRWRILVQGRAAHSSRPHLGVNAINHMARIISALEEDHRRLSIKPHPLVGPATCNVGVIHGGVQVNFVPDECAIEIDRRLLPGERAEHALKHYQGILDELKSRFPDLDARMETPMLTDEGLETPGDAPVVRMASAALGDMNLNSQPCGVPFGCDASKLSRAGVPSIVFGPGSIDRAHAADEFVEIGQVETALEFYRRFILGISVQLRE